MSRSDELKQQIAQLDGLMRDGTLTVDSARQARARLEEELLAQIVPPAPASASIQTAAQPSSRLLLGVLGFVLFIGAAGYAWLGNRIGLSVAPGQAAAATSQAAAHDLAVTQIEGMIDRLAQRLKSVPDDGEGWAMLGRSYAVLGKFGEALSAYRRAVELRPQDAQILADLADALGSANGKSLDGEPETLINKALSMDPGNAKALSLSGTLAFNRNDPATAAKRWERALREIEPNSEMARQVQMALDEARQRAGLPPLVVAVASAADSKQTERPASASPAAASASSSIEGRISLAAHLKGQANAEDTVFVFARPVAGSKAPLAILRKQVKDLPFDFTLDDSLAMSPAMRLSGATEVHVGARISKSGQAMPQPGDLQGISGPIKVGARGVQLEISELIK